MADSFERDLAALTAKFDALAAEVPKKVVATAAQAGANIVKRHVADKAPVKSGDLRAGIISQKERSKDPGKAVYDVMPDPKKNYLFQKTVRNPDRLKGSHAYYPASQEYGFFKRRPGGGLAFEPPASEGSQGDRVSGKYYFARGAAASEAAATKEIISTLDKEIDKIWG